MGRYDATNYIRNKDGILKRDTTIYKRIPKSNNDLYVMSTVGDRFDLLAEQYYGDPHLWWYIAKANNMKFNNIPAGTTLRIPHSLQFAKGN